MSATCCSSIVEHRHKGFDALHDWPDRIHSRAQVEFSDLHTSTFRHVPRWVSGSVQYNEFDFCSLVGSEEMKKNSGPGIAVGPQDSDCIGHALSVDLDAAAFLRNGCHMVSRCGDLFISAADW